VSNFEPIVDYFDNLLDTSPQIWDIILEEYFNAFVQLGWQIFLKMKPVDIILVFSDCIFSFPTFLRSRALA
jgi:hypothetical protein